MDDVWLQLDADGNGSIDLDEFVSGLLDRPAADREVFLVYMNDDGNLPADLVGDALRALGHNPSDAEVIRIVRTLHRAPVHPLHSAFAQTDTLPCSSLVMSAGESIRSLAHLSCTLPRAAPVRTLPLRGFQTG